MSINLEEEDHYYLEGFEDGSGVLKTLVAERDEARKHEAAAYERPLVLLAENTRMRALIENAFKEGFEAGKDEGRELGEHIGRGGCPRRFKGKTVQEYWEASEAHKAHAGLGQEKSVTTDGEIPHAPPRP